MGIKEQIAAWPKGGPQHSEARLATVTEALSAAVEWARPMEEAPLDVRPAWFDQARAVLAALDKEAGR